MKEFLGAAERARAFACVVREEGAGIITEAAQARYEQLFMLSLFDMMPGEVLPASEWRSLASTLKDLIAARQQVEQMRQEVQAKEEARRNRDNPPEDAGPKLVERMRRILGLDDYGVTPGQGMPGDAH